LKFLNEEALALIVRDFEAVHDSIKHLERLAEAGADAAPSHAVRN
jgi:hypothetical protein